MDLRLEFGLYPKSFDGRTAQCPDAVRLDKLMYFRLEPQLDKPVLTNDCGSDVLAGAEKRRALGLESLCLSLLEHSCSSRFEGAYDRGLFGTVDGIGTQILLEPECMEPVQEDIAANTKTDRGAQR